MRCDLAIRTRRAVLPDGERPCTVAIREGRIAAVLPLDAAVEASSELHLAPDEVLLPGLVDTHVHVDEPGRTEWEGYATATAAAAAGGVTTIVDMPLNSIPPTTDPAALQVKRAAAAGQVCVDVGFWGGAVPDSLGHLKALHEKGVYGFKCFLVDSGVPEFPPLSRTQLADALAEVATFDGLLIVHAEDASAITDAPAAQGRHYADFLRSRPAVAEDAAIGTLIALARETGARAHVLHLSSASAIPLVAQAKADGLSITAETCPHYLTLSAETIADGATEFKCCPPIRDAANADALWEALGANVIDLVVSDHSPCSAELKRRDTGDFGQAWGGVSSLQVGLPVVWTEARRRGHSLADVITWMARRPADLVGLAGKGRIAAGADADLVAFAPDAAFTVDPAALLHRHPVTPYAGRELTGVVRTTWLRGETVGGTPRGNLLTRKDG